MKLYLLMLVAILVIFSGCTQTGEIVEIDEGTELNETSVSENVTLEEQAPEEPANPCEGAVCGETITTCPDGFVSTCSNPCDPETGECLPCEPNCTGHEKTGGAGAAPQETCERWCDPTKCEVLDEEECECNIALFCDGNGICEPGEYPDSDDCPACDDGDPCTQDSYDYNLSSCVYEATSPCCGNMECEEGENEDNCPDDCLEEQAGDVRITALNEIEEWVEFEGYNVIMANWTLSDWKEKHVYVFPEWFMINGKTRLHKGYGEDNETDLFWQKNIYVWNNDGDNATLRDENGEIVDFYNYP